MFAEPLCASEVGLVCVTAHRCKRSHLPMHVSMCLCVVSVYLCAALDPRDAEARVKELSRIKALNSYFEAKCRRMKKIKSKKFRKIRRKASRQGRGREDTDIRTRTRTHTHTHTHAHAHTHTRTHTRTHCAFPR